MPNYRLRYRTFLKIQNGQLSVEDSSFYTHNKYNSSDLYLTKFLRYTGWFKKNTENVIARNKFKKVKMKADIESQFCWRVRQVSGIVFGVVGEWGTSRVEFIGRESGSSRAIFIGKKYGRKGFVFVGREDGFTFRIHYLKNFVWNTIVYKFYYKIKSISQ